MQHLFLKVGTYFVQLLGQILSGVESHKTQNQKLKLFNFWKFEFIKKKIENKHTVLQNDIFPCYFLLQISVLRKKKKTVIFPCGVYPTWFLTYLPTQGWSLKKLACLSPVQMQSVRLPSGDKCSRNFKFLFREILFPVQCTNSKNPHLIQNVFTFFFLVIIISPCTKLKIQTWLYSFSEVGGPSVINFGTLS